MPTYSEPPAKIRARFKKMEARAHELDVTESRHRRETGRVRAHIDGRLLEFGFIEGYAEYEEEKGGCEGRSEITEFSRASRWRLMTTLAKVDRRGPVPIFLTLTYPGQWEPDGRVWKEHLNRFWKKAVRRFKKLAAPWKLEPQARMAPHFHALCFGVSRIPWQWVAVNWACIIHGVKAPRAGGKNGFPFGPGKTGAAEFRHWLDNVCMLPEEVKESIRVGTKIEKLRSWRGVVSYVAKYLAKAVPGAWERVGRYWGVIGRKDMPWSRAPENFVDYRTAVLMRRTARRYLRSRGIRVPHQCRRISIITDNMDVWLRMCEACCGAAVRRVKSAGPAAWVNVTREDIERVASSGPCPGVHINGPGPFGGRCNA
jgi:hypothetical protein